MNHLEHEAGEKTCVACGCSWTLWRHEAKAYALKNLAAPKRCKPCRDKRRREAAQAADGPGLWHRGA